MEASQKPSEIDQSQKPSSDASDEQAQLQDIPSKDQPILQPPQPPIPPTMPNPPAPPQTLPVCCRRYFLFNQPLLQTQTLTLQYKHYRYPFKPQCWHQLLKTICGFLNSNGGMILIGVPESFAHEYKVQGFHYSEKQKEEIRAGFVDRLRRVYPEVYCGGNGVVVEFVPVRANSGGGGERGCGQRGIDQGSRHLIRVKVRCGQRNRVYMIDGMGFYFRIQSSVLMQKTEGAYQELARRISRPLQLPAKIHQGPCILPYIT